MKGEERSKDQRTGEESEDKRGVQMRGKCSAEKRRGVKKKG